MSKSPTTPKADPPQSVANEDTGKDGSIISSSHLVSAHSPELSEFESTPNAAYNAYDRWYMRYMAAAGVCGLAFLDVLVVHHVNHHGRAKRLADICFVLNVEDTHFVAYPLKRLQGMELTEDTCDGREVTYAAIEVGKKACVRYRGIRGQCLISNISPSGEENIEIGELVRLLHVLTGLYKQVAQSAMSL